MTRQVHLVDGTYELFRHHYGQAVRHDAPGPFVATAGVLSTVIAMLEAGATHVGVASDHVIESFRNNLWPGYKTSAGMPPELLAQIPILEGALGELGVTCWAMVEWEADDALASAAAVAAEDTTVDQVVICTPDKDLGQCVVGQRVVQLDQRKGLVSDEAAVRAKFGVGPASIPDYLALVGDSADGFPGIPGWGAKSTAAVLARYEHLEAIPPMAAEWDVPGMRGGARLSTALRENVELAYLFRRIATVERDVPVGAVADWAWNGPQPEFRDTAERMDAPHLAIRAFKLAKARRATAG